MQIFLKLRRMFDRNTKIKFLVLLVAIIFSAMLETLSLSLISPFVSILLDNSMIESNQYIQFVYGLLGFSNTNMFLAFLAFLLAAVYIFRGIYLYQIAKIQYRFLSRRQANLSNALLYKILGYSYLYHSEKNLAELQRIIIMDVISMFTMLTSVLLMFSDLFMMLFIVVYLIIISPLMTFCIMLLASICMLLYFKAFRKKIQMSGKKARDSQIGMTKSVNQALGGIKEVKLLRREDHFHGVFKTSSDLYVEASTQNAIFSAIPKLVIESVCFGGAFLILAASIVMGTDISGLVPQFSVFVLAAFRLLPAVSRQMSYVNHIMYHRPSVDAVYKSLFDEEQESVSLPPPEVELPPSSSDIIISNMTFQYPNTPTPVLENISITIPDKKSIAFVGPSGAGKTTLIDVILGILTPKAGGVFFEGQSIHHNFNKWSRCVGYIPQQIYLLDESILENVAFGISRDEIDVNNVWFALEQAQLADFVRTMPDGLNTIVGDRGIRLSGGQRQRIGIARAMYENPPILILDEATSSLDQDTESAVMEAVMGFKGNKTMLIVAHRLSTIEHCDVVYRVDGKSVIMEC